MPKTTSRIEEIVEKLKEASNAYYLGDDPIMSDADFDKLRDELVALDPNNDFLSTIGAPVDDSHLTKVPHEIPMGSLKKINNSDNEYKTWLNSVFSSRGKQTKTSSYNPVIAVSWKLDGSSIELIYKSGKFVQAITRGDGLIGEDVTESIKKAKGFPKKLDQPIDISVRAEALFTLDDFNAYLCTEAKNPRNGAAGAVRRSDGRLADYLHCVAFNIVGFKKWESIQEKIEWLNKNDFETVETNFVTADRVKQIVDDTLAKRDTLKYEIDGLVVSLNECAEQDSLGEKDGIPYWARAWKFPAMGGFSKLLDVSWDVGTRGTINPVAHVQPVSVGGVTISNITLHNMDEIDRLGIQIGDEIEVVRAGDVIPQIIRVTKVGGYRRKIVCDKCPSCGGAVHQEGPFMRCSNMNTCSGVLNKRIMKWIKKREIMFLGDSALDKLIAAKAVSSIRDLYFLTISSMVNAGIGEEMSKKILGEIQKSMKATLSDLLGSLSIDLLGRSEAQNIVDGGFVTLQMWKDLKPTDLLKLGGYQDVKANRICNSLKQAWPIVEDLASFMDIQQGVIPPKVHSSGRLSGSSFCFTGTMSKPRKELQKLVSDNGGINNDGVDSTLTYLVIDDVTSETSKAKKARKLGTKMISEVDFLKMVGM